MQVNEWWGWKCKHKYVFFHPNIGTWHACWFKGDSTEMGQFASKDFVLMELVFFFKFPAITKTKILSSWLCIEVQFNHDQLFLYSPLCITTLYFSAHILSTPSRTILGSFERVLDHLEMFSLLYVLQFKSLTACAFSLVWYFHKCSSYIGLISAYSSYFREIVKAFRSFRENVACFPYKKYQGTFHSWFLYQQYYY